VVKGVIKAGRILRLREERKGEKRLKKRGEGSIRLINFKRGGRTTRGGREEKKSKTFRYTAAVW